MNDMTDGEMLTVAEAMHRGRRSVDAVWMLALGVPPEESLALAGKLNLAVIKDLLRRYPLQDAQNVVIPRKTYIGFVWALSVFTAKAPEALQPLLATLLSEMQKPLDV